jgi:hypothetical protein
LDCESNIVRPAQTNVTILMHAVSLLMTSPLY